ncbi:kinesin-like protein KIF19 isoform X2 [Varroa jacobsoni]|uniref:kinesin-like protein KIF19 isoform X2 n=1 Tax=Varroa jacobsoni TaxID=62625 RepID=UPI000BFA696C|nr:kinesin-like protein KIF19 isoform X2 [Varroa jacobsoni]
MKMNGSKKTATPGEKDETNGSSGKTIRLMVALRIRPVLNEETAKGAAVIANKTDDRTVLLAEPTSRDGVSSVSSSKKGTIRQRVQTHKYTFDWAFDERSPQDEVYSKAVKPLVENVLQGYNSCVFAYGATGTGKTYTMVGNEKNPGIMVRAFDDLFDSQEKQTQDTSVYLSYLEIYNENIRDLLSNLNDSLELREDPNDGYYAVGLSEVQCMSSKEVLRLLQRGNKRRTVEATAANETSSRSHALLKVTIKQQPSGGTNCFGKMFMVDLAGTERTSNTKATGKRLKEGAHINKSLLALGNVINALAMKSAKHVNFRDSKLTRLLKEALGGNCRTLMVAHISPVPSAYEDSRNTLIYADRAQNITNKIRSNVVDVSTHVNQYQGIITELRAEITRLQDKIDQNETNNVKILPMPTSNGHAMNKKVEEENVKNPAELNKLRQQLVESFNKQMMVRSKMMEVDNCLLALSTDLEKLSIVINQWETEKLKTEEGGEPEDEPDYVKQAWEDVEFIQGEQQRFLQLREDIEKEFEDARDKTYELTEKLPHVVTTEDQRELLRLLTQCHKLEVEKIEMQTDQLIREHELRQRDLMIVRYDRQRLLSDEIIIKQKQLIEDISQGVKRKRAKAVQAVKELNDLYRIYEQEIQDLSSGRDTVLKHLNTNPYRPESVLGLRPLGSSESMWELNHMTPLNEEGDDGQPRNDTAPPGFPRRSPKSTDSMTRAVGSRQLRASYSEPVSPAAVNFPPVEHNNFVASGEGDIEKGTRRINSVAQERRQRVSATSRMYRDADIQHRSDKQRGDQDGCQIQ